MRTDYDREFFQHLRGGLGSAHRMLPMVVDLVRPGTVVDVGCGIGVWASVAKELGCDVFGMDGDWVPAQELLIAPAEFQTINLAQPQEASRHFDLAISLEVGEHLPGAAAPDFVRFLTALAPVVMFSAAVPWQQGTHHVNEQYPSYWAHLFAGHGYRVLDLIRPRCWNDREIAFYYRQNTLLFAAESHADLLVSRMGPLAPPLDVIHPDAVPILAQTWVQSLGTAQCARLLRRTIATSVRRRLGFSG